MKSTRGICLTELFNKKTIERLCASVQVTAKQRKAVKEWIELLKSDSLRDEVKNYPNFELIILQDLLGYDLKKSLSHEEGNIEFPFKDDSGKFVVGFEAKGTKTKDLSAIQPGRKKEHESPIKQLWDYMGGKLDLDYGVVTNYKDFILLDKTKGYSKNHFFDFAEVEKNEKKLKEFIAIFSKESIIDKKFLEELYHKSVIEEKEFTKEFYKLFHETRLMLIKEFQDNNATKEDAIHYAQLYLNRLMFVFFAEDTGKLEKRIFERTLIQMLETKNILSEGSTFICDIVTNLFSKLNSGSDSPIKIFGFNGGLFRQEIPRNIYFKDLQKKDYFKQQRQYPKLKHPKLNEAEQQLVNNYKDKLNPVISNLLIMASYDFKTEVNVNILGHIFEQSLSDLEELNEGEISRRKKEGVYYTPEYITDYICKNTIIPHLSKNGATTVDTLLNEYTSNISELEKKFKEIKILDPACGSGAFLIKAVEVLLEIQKGIQEIKQQQGIYTRTVGKGKKKIGGIISLTKWQEEDEARDIIENNIFGVDINEESVEITKLSLFLKIARKNKKLIDLSKNIKCGNSLIDDPEVDEKAFKWKQEFKQIFDKGEFDVIIGNPPYLRVQGIKSNYEIESKYYEKQFASATGRYDIYVLFIEKAFSLLDKKGKLGFILPHKFTVSEFGSGIRTFISEKNALEKIVHFGSELVFEDASIYTCIIILSHNNKKLAFAKLKPENILTNNSFELIDNNQLTHEKWNLITNKFQKILDKLNSQKLTAKDIFTSISQGIVSVGDDIFILKGKFQNNEFIGFSTKLEKEIIIEKDVVKPLLTGTDVKRYSPTNAKYYIIYPHKEINGKTKPYEETEFKKKFPKTYAYLLLFKKELINKKIRYKTNPKYWYSLHRSREIKIFEQPKIITPEISLGANMTIDNANLYHNTQCYSFIKKTTSNYDYYFCLGILNSKILWFYLTKVGTVLRGGYFRFKTKYLEKFPIPKIEPSAQKPIIKKSEYIISLVKEFDNLKIKFLNRIMQNFKIKNSKILESFYTLEFSNFCKELEKQKIKFSLKAQDEWEDYFNQYKKELLVLKEKIDKTDKEIDGLVYELYDLTKEEIQIIEASFNN